MEIKEKTFATKAEACAILRISAPTLNRRIKDGTLAARRLGRLVRIPISELERLAAVQG
jgi:excisionase family DNA binding protein